MGGVISRVILKYVYPVLYDEIINLTHSVPVAVSNAVKNGLGGDYLEFGVGQGHSFILACKNYRKSSEKLFSFNNNLNWRFFAFDAFDDGLPEPGGDDEYKPIHWEKGSMKATETLFMENCKKNGLSLNKIFVIKGYFDRTLTPDIYIKYNLKKAAVIHFDCNLYESTLVALNFCSPLVQVGTILIFDDFFRYRGSECHGQYSAFEDWKGAYPRFKFREMNKFYGKSIAFICSNIK